jgi:hypothetical protein
LLHHQLFLLNGQKEVANKINGEALAAWGKVFRSETVHVGSNPTWANGLK